MKDIFVALVIAFIVIACIVILSRNPVFSSAPSVDADHAMASVAADFAMSEPDTVAPKPDGPKPGDDCSVCNGTGKVGDGRVFATCGSCNGTGKVPATSTITKCGNPFCTCANCTCRPCICAPAIAAKPEPVAEAGSLFDGEVGRKTEAEAAIITPKEEPKIEIITFVSNGCPPCSLQWSSCGGDPSHTKPVVLGKFRFTPVFDAPPWVKAFPTSYFKKGDKYYSFEGWDGPDQWERIYRDADKPKPVAAPAGPNWFGWHWPDGSPADPPGPSNNYYNGRCSNGRCQ
jgi:hypothetical protein